MIDPNLLNLLISTAGSVAGNKIYEYLKINPNPTRLGIMDIIASDGKIRTENVSVVAEKTLNIIAEHGGNISLGEGQYCGGGASIQIGKGGKIDMGGGASIRMG